MTVTGTFTTFKPGILDRILIEKQLAGHVFPLPAAMIYLRQDDTYVMGFCDDQIAEAGRYIFQKDSIRFYDRHNLDERVQVPDRTMYFDSKDTLLYFTRPDPYRKLPKMPNGIIPLKKNHQYAHAGVLRGQDMCLDSLLRYYQKWPVSDQIKWADSAWDAKHPDEQ